MNKLEIATITYENGSQCYLLTEWKEEQAVKHTTFVSKVEALHIKEKLLRLQRLEKQIDDKELLDTEEVKKVLDKYVAVGRSFTRRQINSELGIQ